MWGILKYSGLLRVISILSATFGKWIPLRRRTDYRKAILQSFRSLVAWAQVIFLLAILIHDLPQSRSTAFLSVVDWRNRAGFRPW